VTFRKVVPVTITGFTEAVNDVIMRGAGLTVKLLVAYWVGLLAESFTYTPGVYVPYAVGVHVRTLA
jgi:hypothetical protein